MEQVKKSNQIAKSDVVDNVEVKVEEKVKTVNKEFVESEKKVEKTTTKEDSNLN